MSSLVTNNKDDNSQLPNTVKVQKKSTYDFRDYIPLVSTVVNIYHIYKKATLPKDPTVLGKRDYTEIKERSRIRILVGLIPGLNLILLPYDMFKKKSVVMPLEGGVNSKPEALNLKAEDAIEELVKEEEEEEIPVPEFDTNAILEDPITHSAPEKAAAEWLKRQNAILRPTLKATSNSAVDEDVDDYESPDTVITEDQFYDMEEIPEESHPTSISLLPNEQVDQSKLYGRYNELAKRIDRNGLYYVKSVITPIVSSDSEFEMNSPQVEQESDSEPNTPVEEMPASQTPESASPIKASIIANKPKRPTVKKTEATQAMSAVDEEVNKVIEAVRAAREISNKLFRLGL